MDVQAVVEQIRLKQQTGEQLTQDEQILAQMTPEQLHQVAKLGELEEKRQALRGPSGKIGLGQSLIDQGMPDRGMVGLSSGTSFHRGNTKADYMADAIRKTAGAYLNRRGQARDTKLMGKQTAGRETWMNAAMRQAAQESGTRAGVPTSIARPEGSPPPALVGQGAGMPREMTLEERLRRFGMGQFT